MELETTLKSKFGDIVSLHEIGKSKYQVYAPFFHEDGDMLSIYLEIQNGDVVLRDYGNTLMRVSYTFDLDSQNKRNILNNIAKSNEGEIESGEVILRSKLDILPEAILKYSQIVSKVSNIDILRRETIKSLFYEQFAQIVHDSVKDHVVIKDYVPTSDKDLTVDFAIKANRPIFLFGVNENTKASKVVITCLNFITQDIPFKSFIVHEDFDGLTTFNRNQITNAADKQFTSLDDFRVKGQQYLERELAACS